MLGEGGKAMLLTLPKQTTSYWNPTYSAQTYIKLKRNGGQQSRCPHLTPAQQDLQGSSLWLHVLHPLEQIPLGRERCQCEQQWGPEDTTRTLCFALLWGRGQCRWHFQPKEAVQELSPFMLELVHMLGNDQGEVSNCSLIPKHFCHWS